MYPGLHAQNTPDKAAAIHARTGEVLTYADLDARSNRLAQLLWSEGLRPGDHIAVLLENHLRYFEAELPRLPTGKLYKRLLKDRYWGEKNSRIV